MEQEGVGMTNLLRGFLVLSAGLLGAGSVYAQKAESPKLDFAFDLHLSVGKPIDIGKVGPVNMRRVVPVLGGTLEGPGLKGKILPGEDYQMIHPDLLTEIDAHYVVQLDSGEMLYITNRGVRHGPVEVLQKLAAGEKVDQSVIYFRTVVSVETVAPALQWMNRTIFVATGERQPTEALVHVFRMN